MVTHRFALDQIGKAYGFFASPATRGEVKVVLSRQ